MREQQAAGKWYIAELVEESIVEDTPGNTVWVHHVLLRAQSGEDAYERAVQWAKDNIESDGTFVGPDGEVWRHTVEGKSSRHAFRGFVDLYWLTDDPVDGAAVHEIGPRKNVPEEELGSLVKPKWALHEFIPLAQRFEV
jgi:hypothetical protein